MKHLISGDLVLGNRSVHELTRGACSEIVCVCWDIMNRETNESHMLVIYDQPEPRQILLKAATYSIGRDKRNSIVIAHRALSRQHALLLRMPTNEAGIYRYRILDGNISGKASLNGISVNGADCSVYDLEPNDTILLGGTIRAEYKMMKVPNNDRYFDYLKIQSPQYQSIKAKPLSPYETMVNLDELEADLNQNFSMAEGVEDDLPPTELFNNQF